MGLGLVGIGLGLGLLCALGTLVLGGGVLWAVVVYGLGGALGILGGAGLVLWRGREQSGPQPQPVSQPPRQ